MTGPTEGGGRSVAAVVVHDGTPGARRYAGWVADAVGTAATEPADIDPTALVVASTVVVCCGIDDGPGSPGVRFVTDEWVSLVGSGRRVAVVMVGVAPVTDPARLDLLAADFTPEQVRELKFFQLRGALDVSGLGLRQRLALKAAVAQIRARPRRTPDEQAMLDNGGEMDFTDRDALGPLLRWVRGLG